MLTENNNGFQRNSFSTCLLQYQKLTVRYIEPSPEEEEEEGEEGKPTTQTNQPTPSLLSSSCLKERERESHHPLERSEKKEGKKVALAVLFNRIVEGEKKSELWNTRIGNNIFPTQFFFVKNQVPSTVPIQRRLHECSSLESVKKKTIFGKFWHTSKKKKNKVALSFLTDSVQEFFFVEKKKTFLGLLTMPARATFYQQRLRRNLDLNRGAVFNDTIGVLPSKPLHTVRSTFQYFLLHLL